MKRDLNHEQNELLDQIANDSIIPAPVSPTISKIDKLHLFIEALLLILMGTALVFIVVMAQSDCPDTAGVFVYCEEVTK